MKKHYLGYVIANGGVILQILVKCTQAPCDMIASSMYRLFCDEGGVCLAQGKKSGIFIPIESIGAVRVMTMKQKTMQGYTLPPDIEFSITDESGNEVVFEEEEEGPETKEDDLKQIKNMADAIETFSKKPGTLRVI